MNYDTNCKIFEVYRSLICVTHSLGIIERSKLEIFRNDRPEGYEVLSFGQVYQERRNPVRIGQLF